MLDTVEPLDLGHLLRTAKKTIRELRSQDTHREIRIAVLGGSTTQEIVTLLEIFLLKRGFAPVFWQSEFGRYYEESVLDPAPLADFAPDLVYLHISNRNLRHWPQNHYDVDAVRSSVDAELGKLIQIWDAVQKIGAIPIVQNNFDLPALRILGNLDSTSTAGATHFITELNQRLALEARTRNYLLINDIRYLCSQIGLRRWYDQSRWFSYKLMTTLEGSAATAMNVSALIAARYGFSKKCLVLDLDNTLWGGVIGDDGPDHIVIGRETARAEAYTHFQEYCLRLKDRGVLLAVASKNTDSIARQGFSHPDSVLKLTDFVSFKATWEPKHESIKRMAEELSLGLDSFVFVDDNPAERALVAAQLPMVSVPDVGEDISRYAEMLNSLQYFEPLSISAEDMQRTEQYASRSAAVESQATFASYEEYLESLEMRGEADSFQPAYLDRITQLTNKTNQFNLTTRRFSAAEISHAANDPSTITLYVKLSDRFGDHGLISVLIGRIEGKTLHINLWLMSCRVLKRDVELLALDQLVERAQEANLTHLKGYYFRTPKNGLVSRHYETLGFTAMNDTEESSEWVLNITDYEKKNRSIAVYDATGSVRPASAVVS